ncbi:MAG: alpha/beta fold hydrolase [Candidatus Nanopelagicales bacterium]|nr:alpha/beta fold hydrolase [Candidatus Nanopelagicales bacterium]
MIGDQSGSGSGEGRPITANSVLPAIREPIVIRTSDGLDLVGELALPADREPVATIVCVHPLPTQGGMMDSHLFRKAAWRLPALAGIAVLRFNTRGTDSVAGRSDGEFDGGGAEGLDLAAAISFVRDRDLPNPSLVGWSFGTEVILRHPPDSPVAGVVLISPPLSGVAESDLIGWASRPESMIALIPELDDYLRPVEAEERFAVLPRAELVAVPRARHLWVGEPFVRVVLDTIVRAASPGQLDGEAGGLPECWSGPMRRWSDLAAAAAPPSEPEPRGG